MSLITIEESKLNEIVEKKIEELILNKDSKLYNIFFEVMEDFVLGNYMKEGEKSDNLTPEEEKEFLDSLK